MKPIPGKRFIKFWSLISWAALPLPALRHGDVGWLDEHTLSVDHTKRTNPEGIRQLTALLQPLDIKVITVPFYRIKNLRAWVAMYGHLLLSIIKIVNKLMQWLPRS